MQRNCIYASGKIWTRFHELRVVGLAISLLLCVLPGLVVAQPTPDAVLHRADSLFATGYQAQAAHLYERTIAEGKTPTDAMLLKLASVQEGQNNVPRLLYYLGVYFDRHPNDAVLRRMNDIARANNLSGYETDDLNYFYLFYRKYGLYLLLFLLIPAGYVFVVLVLKMIRGETISGRQKGMVFVYLFLLLIFANLPQSIQSGITNQNRILLRTEPSAAAPVAEVVGPGHKVNVLGSKDIYLRVLWHNKLYFVRQDKVWMI